MAAAEEVGQSQGVPTFVKDLFSGACGGIAQVLIGMFRGFLSFFLSVLFTCFGWGLREIEEGCGIGLSGFGMSLAVREEMEGVLEMGVAFGVGLG